jgi:hypothetical protein
MRPVFPDQEVESSFCRITLAPEAAAICSRALTGPPLLDTQVFLDDGPSVQTQIDIGSELRAALGEYVEHFSSVIAPKEGS